MKKHIYGILAIGLLSSCHDELPVEVTKTIDETTVSSHHISRKKAIENLEIFLGSGSETTRGTSREIESIVPIEYPSYITRADMVDDCDTLLYAINFTNNGGYALVSADNRIPNSVLGVTDTGKYSNRISYTLKQLATEVRDYFDGYPKEGPGIFTHEAYPGETFINPNTVILYQADHDDTLVGDFREDTKKYDEERPGLGDLDPGIGGGNSDSDIDEAFGAYLCMNYALNSINSASVNGGLGPEDDFGNDKEPGDQWKDENSGSKPYYSEKFIESHLDIAEEVLPLISKYNGYNQHPPFNNFFPHRRKFYVVGPRRRAYVGCFNLALAKTMMHLLLPTNFPPNLYCFNINTLHNVGTSVSANNEDIQIQLGYLSKYIAGRTNSLYFYEGTFTFPWEATNFMKNHGFKNPIIRGYDYNVIKDMLKSNYPVLIFSVPGVKITKSHAWIIDGYRISREVVTYEKYEGDKCVGTVTYTYSFKDLAHCDFGWGGASNGYYLSNVFNRDKVYSLDSGSPNPGLNPYFNYDSFTHIISYSK